MIRVALTATVATMALCGAACAQPSIRGPAYADPPPMNRTVEMRIAPQVEALLTDLQARGRGYQLEGVDVFSANDRFLPGKIAVAMAHALVQTPRDSAEFPVLLAGFRKLALLTRDDVNETWGLYYYASALNDLKAAGLLDDAVDPDTLRRLRTDLDWRRFVREDDLTLIDLPNNYYGVAFSIARLRYLLGWEDASASEALLAKTLDHFRQYSGEYGFADETDGEGRFDRYSVLLIGEIAQRFIETGLEPPPEVRAWLRKSVDLMLPRLNLRGEGFEYGRSIGAYGETAFLEVLTAAAALDVLTEEEARMAYAFSSRVAARYADFWIDWRAGSVDLWGEGRGTDAYRGKHRILGENLSLARQIFYTNAIWNRLGFKDQRPDPGFQAWLDRLPRSTTTWFARGRYDRLVVTYRDDGRVIGLPLVNGGSGQHMNTPYFPIPFSPGVLAGSPDQTYPQLLPRLTLEDGSVLMPLAFFEDADVTTEGDRTVVTYRQSAVDRMGGAAPAADDRVAFETRYVLEPGRITRTDRITPRRDIRIVATDMTFASFSEDPTVSEGAATYAAGEVARFGWRGMACREVAPDPAIHVTPVGGHRSVLDCGAAATQPGPFTLEWRLEFR
ncbi:hypothetical protein ACO2Q1_02215 [Brevundimonas sp. VNH65]|uniref:hypothetical protein n=1 Tax=Brevundimonas sp. VNH65 TaxID=3400917 RepID=UPI003C007E0A